MGRRPGPIGGVYLWKRSTKHWVRLEGDSPPSPLDSDPSSSTASSLVACRVFLVADPLGWVARFFLSLLLLPPEPPPLGPASPSPLLPPPPPPPPLDRPNEGLGTGISWRGKLRISRIVRAATISAQPSLTYVTRWISTANMAPIIFGSRQYRCC